MIKPKAIFAVNIAERDFGLVYKNLTVPLEYSWDKLFASIISVNTPPTAAAIVVILIIIFNGSKFSLKYDFWKYPYAAIIANIISIYIQVVIFL